MALIEHTLTGKVDKVKTAIERIRGYDPIRNGYMDTPYYVAYSGGKDNGKNSVMERMDKKNLYSII